jgi:ABC-type antimicrobial peptide transport system permease subunit
MRVTGDPAAAVAAARARVAAIDPLTPLSEARTVREIFNGQTSRHRFIAYLLGGLALFGVVFAVSGVYGVVTLEVARRRREVGLRVALGATATDVIGYMVRRGLRPVLVGAALGVTASLALGPYLKDLLFRVSERDPFSAAAGVGIVVATAAIGCALPARRAARVDPVVALRAE